ncbi:AaceriAFL077Cp [[Ashbya] aceris (nom. inval.)]|nr:AaceriAFL077Cp [[Ashbya] aceris (nom. inval.)]
MSDDVDSETRSRTPSISSRQFIIPEDELVTLDSENSSLDSGGEEVSSGGSEACSAASGEAPVFSQLGQHPSTFFTGSQVAPIFDTSLYLFESLTQSLDSVDFSEALSLQTKTSATINSKSRELQLLVGEVQVQLRQLQTAFEQGQHTAQRVRHNLRDITRGVESLKQTFARSFPIEYHQALERAYERRAE